MASLVVVHSPISPGDRFTLDREETTLGRSSDCDVVIGINVVSRRHARIDRRRDRFVLRDLNSSNGTYINNRRVQGPRLLRDGDRIRLGNTDSDFAARFESHSGPMTEREWLDSQDPWRMLNCLRDREGMGYRKLLLLAAACDRQFPGLWSQTPESGTGVEWSETDDGDLPIVDGGVRLAASMLRAFCTATTAGVLDSAGRASDLDVFCDSLCGLLRELGGNPFRPPGIKPSVLRWNDGTVVKLARAADRTQPQTSGHLDRDLLAVLADALEDAGCTDPELVGHLRGQGPHWRGCWAVDALLGKS
jgi:hypothetical protein